LVLDCATTGAEVRVGIPIAISIVVKAVAINIINRLLFTEKSVFEKFSFIIIDTPWSIGNATKFLPSKLVDIDISPVRKNVCLNTICMVFIADLNINYEIQ
jgi:hypothetical protein